MLTEVIELPVRIRFHARPSSQLAQEATKYQSGIFLIAEELVADIKNPIALMRLGALKNGRIELIADGADEQEAIQAIRHVLTTIF